MKAWAQTKWGGTEVIQIQEVAKPTPGPRDLLVKVLGAATNPVDTKVLENFGNKTAEFTRKGPLILGFDGAGIVEHIGTEVTKFKVGDEVYFAGAIHRQGCFAEYVAIDERIVARKPKTLDFRTASAIPLCALTVWEALVEGVGVPVPKDGEPNPNQNKSILIVAGAGGVGSIAIQIAKKILKFGHVIATSSREDSIAYSKKMGADHVINHKNDWLDELKKINLTGADIVMDNVDLTSNFDQVAKTVNPFGAITVITGASGQLNFGPLMQKRVKVVFEIMFARARTGIEPEKQGQILTQFADWADKGVINPRAEVVFEWNKLPDALTTQASGTSIGKLVADVRW